MASAADHAESHVSIVFFTADRAYKLKKPVSLGFLDFSRREARLAACEAEVRLNRRLAPDVYLGVLTVSDEQGRPVEHLVEMRRLPASRRLATLVARGHDVGAEVAEIARQMAAFHATSDIAPEAAAFGGRDAVRSNWLEILDELPGTGRGRLDPELLARVRMLSQRYLEGRGPLFGSRVDGGFVVDGHGDLLAEDIFLLPDGPRILDCIEFGDRYRVCDVLNDVGFLAMDLERLGAPDLGDRLLAAYSDYSGHEQPASLAHHYIAYRALVRCRVDCIRGGRPARREAPGLLELALRHLEAARPRMVLVGGLPGTGKSSLASGLAGLRDWLLLASDEVRGELLVGGSQGRSPYQEGVYAPEKVGLIYEEMLTRARTALGMGLSVVLDATWRSAALRERAREVASQTASDIVELRCEAPGGLAAERIGARGAETPSAASPEIARMMAAGFDDWPQSTAVRTAGSGAESLEAGLAAVDAPR